jgi:hypothetical protein
MHRRARPPGESLHPPFVPETNQEIDNQAGFLREVAQAVKELGLRDESEGPERA